MKFTLNWLRDHLDTSCSLDEICEGLVSLGHEVEEIIDPAKNLSDFRIVEIRDVNPIQKLIDLRFAQLMIMAHFFRLYVVLQMHVLV